MAVRIGGSAAIEHNTVAGEGNCCVGPGPGYRRFIGRRGAGRVTEADFIDGEIIAIGNCLLWLISERVAEVAAAGVSIKT